MADPEYDRAISSLNSLISGKQRIDSGNWHHAFDMMRVYLERLDLTDKLLRLSVIHVAGTKGKGSTCAMVESMLRSAGYTTGLFTSPHLIDVRERIRINGVPVEREPFLRNLRQCFSELEGKVDEDGGMPAYFRFLTLLGFRIFLEMNVDVVILEVGVGGRLDATNCVPSPVACGVASLGFDHMNVLGNTLEEIAAEKAGIFKRGCPAFTVPQPPEAMAVLQAKAGAQGLDLQVVPEFSSYRTPASNNAPHLGLAGEHQKVNAALAIALTAEWERRSERAAARTPQAAERAASVARGVLPEVYSAGLSACRWPGRGQIEHDIDAASPAEDGENKTSFSAQRGENSAVQGQEHTSNGAQHAADLRAQHTRRACDQQPDAVSAVSQLGVSQPRLTFYLDGAHTAESTATCASWFADAISADAISTGTDGRAEDGSAVQNVLLFNCAEERDPEALLRPLIRTLAERRVPVHHALFVPAESLYAKIGRASAPPDLTWQHKLRSVWEANLRSDPGLAPSTAQKNSGAANGTGANGTNRFGVPSGAPGILTNGARHKAALQLPPLPSLHAGPVQDSARGAVVPNLASTMDWLRRSVREAPALRLRVLVTGSLYLVGDMLRLLGRGVM